MNRTQHVNVLDMFLYSPHSVVHLQISTERKERGNFIKLQYIFKIPLTLGDN